MENDKISIKVNTFIIIAVIVGALLLGLISYFIYHKLHTESDSSIMDDINNLEQILNDTNDTIINNNTTEKEDTNYPNSNTSVNNSSSSENKEPISNSSTSNSSTGKSSSKQSPLSIGEWGIASKYASGGYVNIPTKVTNVTRGSTAAQELKNYLASGSSIYKYTDPKEGMEWAVIEYNIDLTQMSNNTSTLLDSRISGTGDNSSIKYNGKTYIVSTINMTPNAYSKGSIETCKFAVQLPIGCTDYLIVLGSSSGSQAFFNGK